MAIPEPPDETSTLQLVLRLQSGGPAAFDDLYRRHRDELLLAVRSGMGPRLRSAMQSEDVLQSVAMAAFAALGNGESVRAGGLRAFLHRLVRNPLVARGPARQRPKRGRAGP